jgi:phenylacetic acid degradation operon negative regulatory protein
MISGIWQHARAMNAKTEELLWMLLWTCEMISRPTYRNLTESFEGWAYRNGFLRQLQRLEKQQLLECQPAGTGPRLYRLTEAGRMHASGGRDPVAQWKRKWDGRWRLVLFDVPENCRQTRDKLRVHLRHRGFGCLQNSVWITPDDAKTERALLADGPVDVEALIVLEARPCAGESDSEIVTGAWDFVKINARYTSYRQLLARRPRKHLNTKAAATIFHRWLKEEQHAWKAVMEIDPLLPACLLPREYGGRDAWRDRLEAMKQAVEQIRAFRFD